MEVIFFYAEWCGHCENMQGKWTSFVNANKGKGIAFKKIESEVIPPKFSGLVDGFPTFVVFKNGKVVKKVSGEQDDLQFLLAHASGDARGSARRRHTRRTRRTRRLRR